MVTIRELAARCGVSISTVSRAMNARADVNPETRQAILAAAKEYGYVPNTAARSLKLRPSKTVAVIVQGQTSELLIQLLSYIDDGLQEEGYEAFLCHVSDRKANVQTIESLLLGGHYEGVIFLGRYGDLNAESSQELSRSLALLDVPFVFCTTTDFSTSPSPRPSVAVDDSAGAQTLTGHLLDLGHTRIGFALLDPHTSLESEHAWMLRFHGYRQAMERRGLTAEPDWQIPARDADNLYSMSNAYESVRDWLETNGSAVSAVVASCDAVAIGVMRALQEAGLRVPGDVSVTGFDGLDFARYSSPSLTTIVQPTRQIAERTVSALLDLFANTAGNASRQTVQGTLFHGESVGPARD